MTILGIETSCDETAAAVLQKSANELLHSKAAEYPAESSFLTASSSQQVARYSRSENKVTILSNIIASSAQLQAKYGGVIPEQAAREQIKAIIPVIKEALKQAQLESCDLDAIAVTHGPGLIGSLLVGVETAKTLAKVWNKPLIPVNHLIGHFYANWIEAEPPKFPYIGLLISGGHTDLVLFTNHNQYEYLGGTRDDAAGECFDKCARLLGLPYPGGPYISKLAQKGNPTKFKLPIPMKDSQDFDFSYSGLKTAVANLLKDKASLTQQEKADLASTIENTIVASLVQKVIQAAQKYQINQIMVAGGVAANQRLEKDLRFKIKDLRMKVELHIPPPDLCTDNAAMIAAAGFWGKPAKNPLSVQAAPQLALSD